MIVNGWYKTCLYEKNIRPNETRISLQCAYVFNDLY